MLGTQFAAVQIGQKETAHKAIEHFMNTAVGLGCRFRTLETFGEMTVGSRKFVRFRTDCWKLQEVSQQLLKEGRGTILPDGNRYKVEFPTGQKGTLNTTVLQAAPLPSQNRVYRGPKLKFWDRQFDFDYNSMGATTGRFTSSQGAVTD
jgi:hypothetical protein